MQSLEIRAADSVEPATLHAAFAAAFSDYLIGAVDLPLDKWPYFLARQAVDLSLSRVALAGGAIAAFALTAPRPDIRTRRLATMGAPPAMRGCGAAPLLLDDFIERARAAGCAQVELECFAQNERALALYRKRGFEKVSDLFGYKLDASVRAPRAMPQPVTPEEGFAWIDAVQAQRGDLPLQVTPRVLRALPVELQVWRLGTAQVVLAETAPGVLGVQSLLDTDASQRDAEDLMAAVVHANPGKRFAVPQLLRPDVGGDALQRLGFERQPLHQWLMRKAL